MKNRARGIESLSKTGNKVFVSGFMNAVNSHCDKVRAAGVRALGKRWTWKPGRVSFLLPMVDDSSYEVRIAAVKALGELGDRSVVPHLALMLRKEWELNMLGHRRGAVAKKLRTALTDVLKKLRVVDTIPALINVLKYRSDRPLLTSTIRYSAYLTLSTINAPCAFSELLPVLKSRKGFWAAHTIKDACGKDEDWNKVLPLLKRDNPWVRRHAIISLSGRMVHQFIARLIPFRYDNDYWIRGAVVSALGNTKQRRFIPMVLKGLDDRSEHVRLLAVEAISKLDSFEAWGALSKIERFDSSGCVRRYASRVKKAITLSVALNLGADLFINPILSFFSFGAARPLSVQPHELMGRHDMHIIQT